MTDPLRYPVLLTLAELYWLQTCLKMVMQLSRHYDPLQPGSPERPRDLGIQVSNKVDLALLFSWDTEPDPQEGNR